MVTTTEPQVVVDDQTVNVGDQYAIYTRNIDGVRRELARTSLDGIGLCLKTLADESQITRDDPIGILDRLDRRWIVNPWARGARP
jgi:hypothetical protein